MEFTLNIEIVKNRIALIVQQYQMNDLIQLIRYVVFYLPFDVGYKALKFMPVRLMCEALKEVYRAKMVHDGVSHAAKLFPNAYLVMVRISLDD